MGHPSHGCVETCPFFRQVILVIGLQGPWCTCHNGVVQVWTTFLPQISPPLLEVLEPLIVYNRYSSLELVLKTLPGTNPPGPRGELVDAPRKWKSFENPPGSTGVSRHCHTPSRLIPGAVEMTHIPDGRKCELQIHFHWPAKSITGGGFCLVKPQKLLLAIQRILVFSIVFWDDRGVECPGALAILPLVSKFHGVASRNDRIYSLRVFPGRALRRSLFPNIFKALVFFQVSFTSGEGIASAVP